MKNAKLSSDTSESGRRQCSHRCGRFRIVPDIVSGVDWYIDEGNPCECGNCYSWPPTESRKKGWKSKR